MAAPSELTLQNLNGKFVMNSSISDSGDPILKLQGVNYFFRKILNMVSVTVIFKEWVDEDTGITRIYIENKPSSGLPPNFEDRTLNGEPNDVTHTLFGKIRVKTSWASVEELDQVDEYLAKGFEATDKLVFSETEHVDQGLTTYQAFGFEEIKGERRHTRHLVVKKGEQIVRATLGYDYLGPRDE